MKPFTVVIPYRPGPFFERTLLSLTQSSGVERIVIISPEPVRLKMDRCRVLVTGPLSSHETLSLVLGGIRTEYLLLFPGSRQSSLEPKGLERILEVAESERFLDRRERSTEMAFGA